MRTRDRRDVFVRSAALSAALVLLSGCSLIKGMAIKTVANTLADSGDTFTSDNDPELVGAALPFALKLDESLLASVPRHGPLLLATCSAFTSYSYGYVQTQADILGEEHHDQAKHLRERALKLYVRAKNYCVRALEVRFHGIDAVLLRDPETALAKARKKDVPLLYWSASAWGAAIALGVDQPDLAADFPVVRALVERGLALDETWNKGALHETMITIESLGEMLGGSEERARLHFRRAVELQKGVSPGPYVALATGVSIGKKDRAEFERLLRDALAIDPEKDPSNRLVTLITQARARALLDHIDTLFLK
jgi:predicted anti-sigma-YlaC factor YlaD